MHVARSTCPCTDNTTTNNTTHDAAPAAAPAPAPAPASPSGVCVEQALMYLTTGEARELAAVCVSSRSTVDGYGPAYDQLVRSLRPNLEHDSKVEALFKHVRFEKRDYIEYLCMRHPKTAHKHLVRPLMLPPSLRMAVDPTEVSQCPVSCHAGSRRQCPHHLRSRRL